MDRKNKKTTLQKTFYFFDKLEDHIRVHLSKRPITYAIIGGIAIVLFWRGVWHTGDLIESKGGIWAVIFSGPGSIILSSIILLGIGLFVSVFVGDMIVMSGLKREKKLIDKTEDEVKKEDDRLDRIEDMLEEIHKDVEHLKEEIK